MKDSANEMLVKNVINDFLSHTVNTLKKPFNATTNDNRQTWLQVASHIMSGAFTGGPIPLNLETCSSVEQ